MERQPEKSRPKGNLPGKPVLPERERPRSADFLQDADRASFELPQSETEAEQNRAWNGEHKIDLRLSIPLPRFPFYITIVAGREKRCKTRRKQDRKQHPLLTLGNMLLMGYSGAAVAIALGSIAMLATILVIQRFFEIEIVLK